MIVILTFIVILILAIFSYFFILQDNESVQNILSKFKNQKPQLPHNKNIDITNFQIGLSNLKLKNKTLQLIKEEIQKKIIGMDDFINSIIINILCGGHLLVQGVPGLAKTKTIHTFAQVMGMEFKRIQFTPDLLPADIIGVEIYNAKTKEFQAKIGPVMGNIILADEINRASPKVQSALLESMQEKQVTIGGKTFHLPHPFFVLATQNPLEHEGTYPLPEAQIDRFLFKVLVDYPSEIHEKNILDEMENDEKIHLKKVVSLSEFETLKHGVEKVKISDEIKKYITKLINKTREKNQNILYGSSPRGSIGLMLASKALAFVQNRDYVIYDDVQQIALSVLRHRIIISDDAKIQGLTEDQILLDLFSQVYLI
ncbi:MAG: MoxR family ATPase [Candidatus Absconditabacterales bacterium]